MTFLDRKQKRIKLFQESGLIKPPTEKTTGNRQTLVNINEQKTDTTPPEHLAESLRLAMDSSVRFNG